MPFTRDMINKAKEGIDLLKYIENVTQRTAKKRSMRNYFIDPCPFCGHKRHFCVDVEKNLINSFSGCCNGGSIIDFIMQYENLTLYDAIEKVIDLSGQQNSHQNRKNTAKLSKGSVNNGRESVNMSINFNEFIDKVHKNIGQTDYFFKRGLTEKIINKYKLGFCEEGFNYAIRECNWLKETENKIYKYYRYFLPVYDSDNNCKTFITRLDEDPVPKDLDIEGKTHNLKGYPATIFNDRYLLQQDDNNVTFITEGIFDALSLEEFDYKAIALNSTQNADIFMKIIDSSIIDLHNRIFILIPDNDGIAGNKLKEKLIKYFKERELNLFAIELPKEYKDANEFLAQGRDSFIDFIKANTDKIITNFFNEGYNSLYIDEFINSIKTNNDKLSIKSGFNNLDLILDGGFYPGLYTIGAMTSLGKTTFMLQIADYIAKEGSDVLFFSLEMSREELMRKSLSRETFLINPMKSVSSRDIMKGYYEQDIIKKALEGYEPIAKNIAIIQGSFNTSVQEIRLRIERNIKIRGKRPAVIVDYLQILKPLKYNMTDKQAIDYNITELKKISRDYNVPVILISSLNRSNYTNEIGYESFKESGAIEYSSDVVIGLQLKGIERLYSAKNESEKRKILDQLKARNPREIELVIIKQREGIPHANCPFEYFPKFNCFIEVK